MHVLLGVELPLKQIFQLYDLDIVAYSVSTPLTLERGASYKVGDLRQVNQIKIA